MNTTIQKIFFGLATAFLGIAISGQLVVQAEEKTDIVFAVDCHHEDARICSHLESNDSQKVVFPRNLKQGESFSLSIFIKNPEQKNIVTAQSWLQYDTSIFQAIDLSDDDSDFSLAAPDGNEIDAEAGIIKIGRGRATSGENPEVLFLAKIDFQVISDQKTTSAISFVNFQKEDLGDTGVFILNESTFQPENILLEEPKKLEIPLNNEKPVNTSEDTGTPEPSSEQENTPPTNNNPSEIKNGIQRPQDVVAKESQGKIVVSWKPDTSGNIAGYFVYYSENSGFYIRRKNVGFTNTIEFTDLTPEKNYFFAVTAYDQQNKESEYSHEVTLVAPQRSQNSSGIVEKNTNTPVTTKENLDPTGPEEVFSLVLLVLGTFFFIFASIKMHLFRSFSQEQQ